MDVATATGPVGAGFMSEFAFSVVFAFDRPQADSKTSATDKKTARQILRSESTFIWADTFTLFQAFLRDGWMGGRGADRIRITR